MPLPSTMTPIATQTLTASAATITFSNIPQGYTDLVIVTSLRGNGATTGDDTVITFNGDSGTNYSWTRMYGTGSVTGSSRNATTTLIRMARHAGASSAAGTFSSDITHILNYSNTTTYKTTISRANDSSLVETTTGLWRSTAAITSFSLGLMTSTTFESGSTVTLYGIKAA